MGEASEKFRLQCGGCGVKLQVSRAKQGQSLKCPACGFAVHVQDPLEVHPDRSAQASTESSLDSEKNLQLLMELQKRPEKSPEQELEALLKRFHGEFPRPRPSVMHGVTAFLVAVVMLLLPVVYLVLIVAVGWMTYWHAQHDWVWATAIRGRASAYAGLAYVALIVTGCLWVISMLKPIFQGWGRPAAQEGLSRSDEPLLFLFSDRLADVVGCPRPDVILLTADVNASASFETAVLGLVRRRFQLSLGIPLVAGLSLEQLAGVIAHEFGHFSQQRSTLLLRIINRINSWFAQAVYQHDMIDDVIETLTDSEHFLLMLLGTLMWAGVCVGRGILWCLLWVASAVSSTLLRQMEYNADQYECGVVGSQVFAETSRRMQELMVATAVAQEYIFTSQNSDHLPDDFAAFVAGLADRHGKISKKAQKMIREEQASWLMSHPPTRLRIAAAEKLNLPGIFSTRLSGKKLFRNFQQRARHLTLFFYTWRFGPHVNSRQLRPVDEALETYLAVLGGNRERQTVT